ncbi:MAG TPA: GNAT family N-acetyltransferase [Hyphomicrobium sp.]|nr:GNAT family N-acetyltransferase [Hyphomicrobium sp.]
MPDVEICRWTELAQRPDHERLIADLDHVFFSSSARQSFSGPTEKAEFRERWLGRYLESFPDYALVALDESGRAVGYVIGSLDDPAHDPVLADLAFLAAFSQLTARYPAQLHVNLDADWRGRGIGARLVDAFCDLARAGGAPGVHIVTARGMRNVGFYLANDFHERGATLIDGKELLLLGRDL